MSGRPRVCLVTGARTAGLAEDDRRTAAALAARGIDVCGARWDDPEVDWSSGAAATFAGAVARWVGR